MNWEVVEPALTRILKETEAIRNALEERKTEQRSILQKLDALLQRLEQENGRVALTAADVRLLLGLETEKIKNCSRNMTLQSGREKASRFFPVI